MADELRTALVRIERLLRDGDELLARFDDPSQRGEVSGSTRPWQERLADFAQQIHDPELRDECMKVLPNARSPLGTSDVAGFRTRISKSVEGLKQLAEHITGRLRASAPGDKPNRAQKNPRPADTVTDERERKQPKEQKKEKVYGRWKVIQNLSGGGQGTTYLVVDRAAPGDRFVLKRLTKLDRINRLRNEHEALRQLSHPGIVELVDADLDSEKPFIVTAYCEGGTLEKWSDEDHSLMDTLRMFQRIASAIAAAHSQEILHRDIKPANVFLDSTGLPKVGDFGLSLFLAAAERQTETAEAVGARHFMAPELEDGRAEKVTKAADVYSLGKLLYWMVAGRIFSREKHREDEFDLTRKTDTPPYHFLNEFFDRTIVTTPAARLQDASAVVAAVEELIRRVENKGHVLSRSAAQPCMFCAAGHYKVQLDTSSGHRDAMDRVVHFGLHPTGSPKWLILVCDTCGNMQHFRLDLTKDPGAWK